MLNQRKMILGFILLLLIIFPNVVRANAIVELGNVATKVAIKSLKPLGKVDGALPDSKIKDLVSQINKAGDIKKVGKIIGEMNLSKEVLEDTFMRILIMQNKISKKEAEEIFTHLRGVEGFTSAMSKAAGVSAAKTSGHLNELRIATGASKNGFEVVAIGQKFTDGLKKGTTDLDIILKKKGRTFVIEAKDYDANTPINMDYFRADMDTLVAFKKQHPNTIPVFTITNPPANAAKKKLLEKEAERRGVQLVYGNADEIILQVNHLSEVLK
ncbi:MAG: hypothetical protein JZU65_24505 [Chlorobium sp.]|nr:hypothetical protein [Chlorobium sp.]